MLDPGDGDWVPPSIAPGTPGHDLLPPTPPPVRDVAPMFNSSGPNATSGYRDYAPPQTAPVVARPVQNTEPMFNSTPASVAAGGYMDYPQPNQPMAPQPAPPQPVGPPLAPYQQSPDAVSRNLAATPIPMDQAGFSADYVNRSNPVGGQGELSLEAHGGSDYGTPLTGEGLRAGGFDVPPNVMEQIRAGQALQAQLKTTALDHAANTWQKDATGRPTSARMGVQEGVGGLGRPELATFQPSNAVMKQALAKLPPIFQQFAGEKINRPSVHTIYGDPSNVGGNAWTDTPGDSINIGRGAGDQTFGATRGSPDVEVSTAVHELLHTLSYTQEPYKADSANNFRGLGQAILADKLQLENAPQYRVLMRDIGRFGSAGDWGHVWTAVADAAAKGMPLPPALQAYFAPMMQPAAVKR